MSVEEHPEPGPLPGTTGTTRRAADQLESRRAQRAWWDFAADDYQAAHAVELGKARVLWCPEGLVEPGAGLLADVADRDVLEVGCGGAQCARWIIGAGARSVAAIDLSGGQLRHAQRLSAQTGIAVPLAQADATALPFRDQSFDVAMSAYGALPFVADSATVMREIARVLRRQGRWVFSVTHPFRWCLPDDAADDGLRVTQSYFDRRPYVEVDASGAATYVEHHRTMGDRVRELVDAGFRILDLVEPEWPTGEHDTRFAQWTEERGRLLPGTAIWVTEKA
ncbi:MAG: class I SAM-dependent methyltransferase [Mycobacteriales bacterium]|nr:methyltransferase domain-containing protein [Frankia sp.]